MQSRQSFKMMKNQRQIMPELIEAKENMVPILGETWSTAMNTKP